MAREQGILEDLEMNDPSLQAYAGKKVLVTGDTGFKGSWLAIWLLKLGATVTGYGLPPKRAEDNYQVTSLGSKYHHINGDIRDLPAVMETVAQVKPDIIFHLAAQALVLDSYKDPHGTFEANVTGTLNVLEAIRNNPSVKAAVMVTSDKCYRNREWIHGYRETDALGGDDPYSASKGAAELVINSYSHSFFSSTGTPAIASVRAGNVIGGGDWSDNRIIPDCIRSLTSNTPIIIRNPGSVRPWQHVLEPLYGYLMLGSALCTTNHEFSGAWNFGPVQRNAVTVETLVQEMIRQWGSGSYRVERSGDQGRESAMLMLDISKAIHRLHWHPVLSLRDALRFTLDEYRISGMTPEGIFRQRNAHIDEYLTIRKTV
jgi:CDP-glucose 4,6-dehydratase